tara:strand:- start:1094 stop:1366 length:273 start_codon:yes stop_codon:yes gene_type:complete
MAKKTNDLKITDKELENIQSKVKNIQAIEANIGRAEIAKMSMLEQVKLLQTDIQGIQVELEEKYGKVSINLQDGTISEIPEEDGEADKKD